MIGKGIAVSQIILLVLGILVLAVIAFLLYSNFTSTGNTLNAETCRAEATRLCTGCYIGGSTDKCEQSITIMEKCDGSSVFLNGEYIDCVKYIGGGGSSSGSNNNEEVTDAVEEITDDVEEVNTESGTTGTDIIPGASEAGN